MSPVRHSSKCESQEDRGHDEGIESDVSIGFRHISSLLGLDIWPKRLEWVWSQAHAGRLKGGTRKGLLRQGKECQLCKWRDPGI